MAEVKDTRSKIARVFADIIEDGRRTYESTPEKYKEDVKSYLIEDGYENLVTE